MSLQTVPLLVAPNQSFSVVLNDRDVGVRLRTMQGALYVDVTCNGVAICAGQLCLDRVPLTPRAAYLGFPDLSLVFADLQGTSDPVWSDFGTRHVLLSVGAPDALDRALSLPEPVVVPLLYDGSVMYDGSHTFDGNIA